MLATALARPTGNGEWYCGAFPCNSPAPQAVIMVVLNRAAIAILALLLCACDRLPETYPPTAQRQPPAPIPDPSVILVEMSDPDSYQHISKNYDVTFGCTSRLYAQRHTDT